MARKKITIQDIKETFAKAKVHLSEDASIMPMGSDEGQVILTNNGKGEVYAASTLKGHLEFLVAAFSDSDELESFYGQS